MERSFPSCSAESRSSWAPLADWSGFSARKRRREFRMARRKTADMAPADGESKSRRASASALRIFLAALAVRWIYALWLYTFMGDAGLEGVDSTTYAAHARSFAEALGTGSLHGSQWLGVDPYMMPLFQWLTTLPFLV